MIPSALAPYMFNSTRTRILALDVAKNETGYCVVEVPAFAGDRDEVQYVEWGRFLTDARNDNLMFLTGDDLYVRVREEIRRHREVAGVHVVIEHPVFGKSRSEQQYYLFQLVLRACHDEGVNVTTIGVNFLKGFIKRQMDDATATILMDRVDAEIEKGKAEWRAKHNKPLPKPKKKRRHRAFEKAHIKATYAEVTRPLNPTMPEPEAIANDDEYDAIYLAWLATIFAADIPDLDLTLCGTDRTAPYANNSLMAEPKLFRPIQARKYANAAYPSQAGLTHLLTNFRKNGHGGFGNNLDYYFQQLELTRMIYEGWREQDPKAAKAWLKTRGTPRTVSDDGPTTSLSVNFAGKFFTRVPARRKGTENPLYRG
jgi:hypothetical protein